MAKFLKPLNWFQRTDEQVNNEIDSQIRKAKFIDSTVDSRENKTNRLSVSTYNPNELNKGQKEDNLDSAFAAFYGDQAYANMISFNFNDDKKRRIQDFRRLAKEPMLEACLHEIATSCMASHDKEPPAKGSLTGTYSDEIIDVVNKEIAKVISYFQFEKKGLKYFKEFLTTGELAFENVFSLQRPELGLLDVKKLLPENLNPIFQDFCNEDIHFFNYKKPKLVNNEHPNNTHQAVNTLSYDNIPMARSQVTYLTSGEYEEGAYDDALGLDQFNKFKIRPYIMKGFKANRRLDLIEDSMSRNAIANGTDKLAWNIPVGNMEGPAVETFMNKLIQGFKRKKGISGNGEIYDQFNPNSIHEDYYFPVRQDGQTASVNRITGSNAFASFKENLGYFRERVYEMMLVPISRLNPDTTRSDGTTITAQEFAFSERVIQLQEIFASAIKETIITHLKLKGLKMHKESCESFLIEEGLSSNQQHTNTGELINEDSQKRKHLELIEEGYYSDILVSAFVDTGYSKDEAQSQIGMSYWEQYGLLERDIDIEFSLPTNFLALREQQLTEIRLNVVNQKITTGVFAPELVIKEVFNLSDDDLVRNRQWNLSWAKHQWELAQITENGPEFRENAAAEAGVGGGLSTELGGGGDIGGGDGNEVPEFGDSEALDDIGNEAPEGGAEPPVEPTEPETPASPTGDTGEEEPA